MDAEPPRRAGVSRRVRHAVAVSRLRRPAGQQHLVRAERRAHQQRHHQRRLVRDQRRRRFPAADGSDRRAHRLRRVAGRPHEPHRSAHQRAHDDPPGARRAEAGRNVGLYRFNWDTAMQLSPFDPATIYIGANLVLKSSDRGRSYQPISPDLTTNTDREALSIMGVVGKDVAHRQERRRRLVRQHRHARRIRGAAGRGVGRQRRWRRERDAGCGQDVDQRHVEDLRRAEVDLRVGRAAVARVSGHGVRGLRRPSRRRLQHLRVRDHRLRRDVAIDRRQPAEGRSRARSRRGSQEPGHPLSRHRNRLVGELQPRRAVDAHQGQPADDADLRDQAASARQRPDSCESRARHLDPRRPVADPGVGEVRERRCVPVQLGGRRRSPTRPTIR